MDEDDAIAVAAIFQGESTGAATGGGASGGATTSPQSVSEKNVVQMINI
jgi:hypothetical protein